MHTWGQSLSYHPHVHFIVPGGGLCLKTNKFKTTHKNFFLPIKIVSKIFRAIFIKELKSLFENKFILDGHTSKPIEHSKFDKLINSLYKKQWIVFSKENFDSPGYVIKYLCQYTHRIAISNQRILATTDTDVVFKYKDYKDNCKTKVMKLKGAEFIRRFLMHVLPSKFVKIRHYGILAGRNRPTKLALCQRLMNIKPSKKSSEYTTIEFLEKFMKIKPFKCSKCSQESHKTIGIAVPQTKNLN